MECGTKCNSKKYERLVPERFRKQSGFNSLHFKVVDASHYQYQFIRHLKGGAIKIPLSAYCKIDDGRMFIIDIIRYPEIAEAIILLGQLMSTNERAQRYNILFKIYECIEQNKELEFSAIRHALSHASSKLSRPRTIDILNKLFGTTRIDLNIRSHERVFYSQMVKLLNETDKKLYNAILKKERSLIQLIPPQSVLQDWQIDGVPGLINPIPLRTP